MAHYLLELALWILAAFLIGTLLGALVRRLLRGHEAAGTTFDPAEDHPASAPEPAPAPVPAATVPPVPVAAPAPAPAEPEPAAARMARPRGLESPRGGKADPLQRISGIGPKNEKILHNLGFYHFDQIAQWTAEQIAWVDDHLKFNGRIGRELWVEQSRLLAVGEDEEFERRFGSKRQTKQT
jgi:NADH-quinone oxidoreductase subunit E